jgi:signal transduction histidine kinase
LPNDPIDNLQDDLIANHNLLDAIAGTAIAVTVRTEGGARPVRLSSEDLTRVLVNLVKNASEAMNTAGRIEISLTESLNAEGAVPKVVLAVEDSGPGIPADRLEKIFDPGYTAHAATCATGPAGAERGGWSGAHRGLGLSITRSIVEAAGGRVRAVPRIQSGIQAQTQAGPRIGGARIELELPVRIR